MALPEHDRFTLEDLADRWKKSIAYIDELVRTCQFSHILVIGERIGNARLTRHVYFDRATYVAHYGDKVAYDRGARQKEYEETVRRLQKDWKKRFGTGAQFDPTSLRQQYEERYAPHYDIGPHEVASLWNEKEWKRPGEQVRVYVPRSAVRAFEQKHGIARERNDKSPIPDISEIQSEKWYTTAQAARFLDVTHKYLQNELVSKLSPKKVGKTWRISGRAICEYLKGVRPDER
jgi:hypothetical protein